MITLDYASSLFHHNYNQPVNHHHSSTSLLLYQQSRRDDNPHNLNEVKRRKRDRESQSSTDSARLCSVTYQSVNCTFNSRVSVAACAAHA